MKKFGPGLLVAAAFIGPGTVTTASVAGANFGFVLLWALLFSVIATMVLQEMAARLGIVTQKGLADAMRSSINSPILQKLAMLLVVLAIGFGNAAYEAGNISGASLGASSIVNLPSWLLSLVIGGGAALLLVSGKYKLVEGVLIALVLLMSLVFILTFFMVPVDWQAMLSGIFVPSLPDGALLTVIALIGTTVVPYNLFLHANAVREKWLDTENIDTAMKEAKLDSRLSIGLGGLITLAIVSTSASAFFASGNEFSAATLASQLEPLLGPSAKYFFAIGLMAAGLTSAITAPLAAAYAVCGAMNWSASFDSRKFQAIWAVILVIGTLFAALGTKPLAAIIFAQAANGFLLPIVAIFLLWVMNRKEILGEHVNRFAANLLGGIVVLVVSCLGLYKFAGAIGLI